MSHVLIYSTSSELDARLVEGKLKNEGFDVKTDYSLGLADGKTMKPRLFGIYVSEADSERAKSLLAVNRVLPTKNPSVKISWTVALIIIIIAAMAFLYIRSKI